MARMSMDDINKYLSDKPFYIVSNRAPYQYVWEGKKDEDKRIEEKISRGGLTTSMNPVIMKIDGATWVAWAGGSADREYTKRHGVKGKKNTVAVPMDDPTYLIKFVNLTEKESDLYYYGLSNRMLWPLHHEVDVLPIFHRDDYWKAYCRVNRKFAESVAEEIPEDETPIVSIQDYHLMPLPGMVRKKVPQAVIPFYLHIPWSSPERYSRLRDDWKLEILDNLFQSDIVGLQTDDDVEHCLECVEWLPGSQVNFDNGRVKYKGREVIVKDYPIGIDFNLWENMAKVAKNPDEIKPGKFLIYAVSRLDYTKGIKETIRGAKRFFEKYGKQFKGNIVFEIVVAPSRTQIPEYRQISSEVRELENDVNKFRLGDWKPLDMNYKGEIQEELARRYHRADACIILPHHDGQNLIPKEFIASQIREKAEKGVVILSKFAGAAKQLGKYCLEVNPFDPDEVAEAIKNAVFMSKEEKNERMKKLRSIVRKKDIYWWFGNIMSDTAQIFENRKRLYDGGDIG